MSGVRVAKSSCFLCMGDCGLDVEIEDARAVRIEGSRENPLNRGVLCTKGNVNLKLVYHPDRLLYPLRRRGERDSNSWERISWEAALDIIAARLQEIKKQHGPEAVAFYVGYVKEPRRWLQRLAYLFGSPNFVTESSVCNSAREVANRTVFGYASLGEPDLERCRCLLSWSSNPAHSNSPNKAGQTRRILAARSRGMRLIVIDPRRTHLAGLADFFLQLRPGTDGALALGMLRVIIEERLYDQDFVAKWVRGFNELKAAVARYTPEETERITGIPAEKIAQAARMFATVGPAALMESASATTHTANGVQNHRAILALVGLTGNFDAPGGNVIVPAVQTRNITLYHEKIASLPRRMGEERWPVWARLYPEGQCNMMADQILSGKPHPIKGMVAVGANVRMGPDSRKTIAAWKSLDFLVASDFFMTSTTRLADIVLPAAFSLERTNLIVRGDFVMLRQAALEPPGEVWPDQRFIFELAARLGLEDKFWNGDLELAFAEELEPSGITLDELKQNPGGIRVDLGPVQYYKYREKGFPTPSGKMEIRSSLLEEYGYEPLPIYREPPESPLSTPELAREFPLVLTTGGRLPMFVHTMLRNVEAIRRLHPEPQVDINPKDARSRGIACGDKVILATPRGEITFVANVTVAVPPGVVHVLHGWEQADINEVLEGDNLDPISGFPCFKGVLCQVKRRFGSSGQTPTPPAAAPSKG